MGVQINKNEMTIIYKIEIGNIRIKLFGEEFIKNNKNNCKIILNNKEFNIFEYLSVDKNNEILKIKLKEIKAITNMSHMFSDCKSLQSLTDISNWNTINVTDMSYMFYNCESLTSLSDIDNWNTNNVTNMRSMFYNCNSLTSLPDISNWNTNNVTNMKSMFSNCNSLPLQFNYYN